MARHSAPVIDSPLRASAPTAVASRAPVSIDAGQPSARQAAPARQQTGIDQPTQLRQSFAGSGQATIDQPTQLRQTVAPSRAPTTVDVQQTRQVVAPTQQSTVVSTQVPTFRQAGTIQPTVSLTQTALSTKLTASTVIPQQAKTVEQSDTPIQSQPLKYIPTPTQVIIGVDNADSATVTPIAGTTANVVSEGTTTKRVITNTPVSNSSIATGPTTVNNQRISTIVNAPGGTINGEVQFLSNGKFKADKDFKYDSSTDTLLLTGKLDTYQLHVGGLASFGTVSNVFIYGGTSGQQLRTDGGGNLSWVNAYTNADVQSYLVSYTGNISAGQINANNITATGNVNLGAVGKLTITGGSTGQVLTTNGSGNLSWATITADGNVAITSEITNGSSNVVVNADSSVTFGVSGQSEVLTISNTGAIANLFTSNNYTLGDGTTTISTNRWLDAITTNTNPTILFQASNSYSSIDVHITANSGNAKQISKMLSVTQGNITHYSQYGNVYINNELADFTMDQSGGNVRVIATPETTNRVDYRLVITLYN